MKNEEWIDEILRMDQALSNVIHSMITYKNIKSSMWNEKDVIEGWDVLERIIKRYKEKLK